MRIFYRTEVIPNLTLDLIGSDAALRAQFKRELDKFGAEAWEVYQLADSAAGLLVFMLKKT